MEEITIERLMNDMGSVISQINEIVVKKDIESARLVLKDVEKLIAEQNGIVLDEESRPDYDHVLHELLKNISGVIEIVIEKDNSLEIARLEQELADIERDINGDGDNLRSELENEIAGYTSKISELEGQIGVYTEINDIERKIRELTDKIVNNNQTPQLDENRAKINEPLLAERKELENRLRELIILINRRNNPDISLEEQEKIRTDLEELKRKLADNNEKIASMRAEIQGIDNYINSISNDEQVLSEAEIKEYNETIVRLRQAIEAIGPSGKGEDATKLQEAANLKSRASELRRQADELEAQAQGKKLTEEQKRRKEELIALIADIDDQIKEIDNQTNGINPDIDKSEKDKLAAIGKKRELEGKIAGLEGQERTITEKISELSKIAKQKLSDEERARISADLKKAEDRKNELDSKVRAADPSKISEAANLREQAESLRKSAESLELEGNGKDLDEEQRALLNALLSEISDLEEQLKGLDAEKIVDDPKIEEYAQERQAAIDERSGLESRLEEIDNLEKELNAKRDELLKASEGRLSETDRESYANQIKIANARIEEIDSLVKDEDAEKMAEAAELKRQAEELKRQADELEIEGQGRELTEEEAQRKTSLLERIAELEGLINDSEAIIPDNSEAEEYANQKKSALEKRDELKSKLTELRNQELELDRRASELNKKKGPRLTDEQREAYNTEIDEALARITEIDNDAKAREGLKQRKSELEARIGELRDLITSLDEVGDFQNPEIDKNVDLRAGLTSRIEALEGRIQALNGQEADIDGLIAELEAEEKLLLSDADKKNHNDEIEAATARIAEIDLENETRDNDARRKAGLTERIASLTDLLEQDSNRRENEDKKEIYLNKHSENLGKIEESNLEINGLEEENTAIDSELGEIAAYFELEETLSEEEISALEHSLEEKSQRLAEIDASVEMDDQYSKGARTLRAHADKLMEAVARSEQIIESIKAQKGIKNKNTKIQAQIKVITTNKKAADKRYDQADKMEARSQKGKISEELAKEKGDLLREVEAIRDTLVKNAEKSARNAARDVLEEEQVNDYRSQIETYNARITQIYEDAKLNDPDARGARTLRAKANRLMELIAEHEAVIASIEAEEKRNNKSDRIQKQEKEINSKRKKVEKLLNLAAQQEARAKNITLTEEQLEEVSGLEARIAEVEVILEENEEKIANKARKEELDAKKAQNLIRIADLRADVSRLESENFEIDSLVAELDDESRGLATLTDEQRNAYQAEVESASAELEKLDSQELDEFAKGARTLRAKADNLMAQVAMHNARIEEIRNDKSIKNKNSRIEKQNKEIKSKTTKANKLYNQAEEMAARSKTIDNSEIRSREKTELLLRIAELRGILEQDEARRSRVEGLTELRNTKAGIIADRNTLDTERTGLESERAEIDKLIASLRGESERRISERAAQRKAYEEEIARLTLEITEIDNQIGFGDDEFAKGARTLRANAAELEAQVAMHNARIEEIQNDKSIKNKSILIDRQNKQIREKTEKIRKLYELAEKSDARAKTRDVSKDQEREKLQLEARIAELRGLLSQDDERKLVDEQLAEIQTNRAAIDASKKDIASQIAGLDNQISELENKIRELDDKAKEIIAAEEAKREKYRAEIARANEEIAGLDALVVPKNQEKLDKAVELRAQADELITRAAELEEIGKARALTPEEIQEKEALRSKITELSALLNEDDIKQLAADELLGVEASLEGLNQEKENSKARIGELNTRIEELDGLINGLSEDTRNKIAAMEAKKQELTGKRNAAREKAAGLEALIVLPDPDKLNLAEKTRRQAEELVARAAELENEGKEVKLTDKEMQERAGLDTLTSEMSKKLQNDELARNAETQIAGLQSKLEGITREKDNLQQEVQSVDEEIRNLEKLIERLSKESKDKIEEAQLRKEGLLAQKKEAEKELKDIESQVVLADASKKNKADDLRREAESLVLKAAELEKEGKENGLSEEQLKTKQKYELEILRIQEILQKNEQIQSRNSSIAEQTQRKDGLLTEISSLEGENDSLKDQIKKLEEQLKVSGTAFLTREQREANEEELKRLTAELEKAKNDKAAAQARLDNLSQNKDKEALEQRRREIQERLEQLKTEQRDGVVTDRLDLGAEAANIGDAIFKTAEIRKELASRQISRDQFLKYYQDGLAMTNAERQRLNADLEKLQKEQRILIVDEATKIDLNKQLAMAIQQGDKAKEINISEELRKRFIKIGREEDLNKIGITGEIKTEEDLSKFEKFFKEYKAYVNNAYEDIVNDRNELNENAQIFTKEIEKINAEKVILDIAQDPAQLEADSRARKEIRRKLLEASITPKNELTEEQRFLIDKWQEASERFLSRRTEDKEFAYIGKDGAQHVIQVSSIDDSYNGYKDDVFLLGVPDYKENLEQISAFEKTQDPYVFGLEFAKAYEAAEAQEPGAGKVLLDQIIADKNKYVETFNGIPNPHKVRYETLKTAGSTLKSMTVVDKNLPLGTRAANMLENVGRFFGIRTPKFYKYNDNGERVSDILGGVTTLALDGLVVGAVATAAVTMGPVVAAMGYAAKGLVTAGNVVASRIVYNKYRDEIDGNKPVLNQADPNSLEVARKAYYREQGDNRFVAWAKAKIDRYITKDNARTVRAEIVNDLVDEYNDAEDKRTAALKTGLETAERNQKVREERQSQIALGANVYNEIVRDPDSVNIDHAEAAIARNAAIESYKPGKGREDVNPNATQPKKEQYVKEERPVLKTEEIDTSEIDEVQGPVSAITAEQIYTGKKQQVDRINRVLTMVTTIGLKFGYEAFKTGFTKTETVHHDAVTKTETVHHDAVTKTETVHHDAEYADVEVPDYQTQYDTDSTFDGIIENATGKEVEGYYSVYGEETQPQTYVINEDDSITAVFQAEGRGGTGISDSYGLQAPTLTDRSAGEALLDLNKVLRNDLKISEFFDALKDANVDPTTLDGMYVSVGDRYWVKLGDLMQGMTKEVAVGSHIETQLIKEAWDETVTTVVKEAWDETITKTAPELAINALKDGSLAGMAVVTADTLHEAVQTTYIAGNTPGRPEETMPLATIKFDKMAERLQEETNRKQERDNTNRTQNPNEGAR